uniref:BACK domain-containing protein n=1 Tax=Anas platyrhynchos TaxID=8839 RepID=A0A8B9TVH4_ANAPL
MWGIVGSRQAVCASCSLGLLLQCWKPSLCNEDEESEIQYGSVLVLGHHSTPADLGNAVVQGVRSLQTVIHHVINEVSTQSEFCNIYKTNISKRYKRQVNSAGCAGSLRSTNMHTQTLCEILDRTNTEGCSELELFRAAVNWLQHDRTRLEDAADILRRIRFPLIPLQDLQEFVQEIPFMKLDSGCHRHLQEALTYQSLLYAQPLLQTQCTSLRSSSTTLLIAGGRTIDNCICREMWAADKSCSTWYKVGDLRVPLYNHCVAIISDFLFVIGGQCKLEFYRQLTEAAKSSALVLVGDFNFPDISWKHNTAQRKQSRRFLESVEDSFLTQLISEPTRGGALLDLLFTNREGLVEDVIVGNSLGQSDHEMVEFTILGGARKGTSKTTVLDFRRADFGLLRTLVGGVPWEAVLKGRGVQKGWALFKRQILMAQERSIPMRPKMSQRGRRPAWLNRELWLELRRKKRVYNLWKIGQATKEDYKDVARLCRDKIRKAKAHLELNLATAVKDNKKRFYKYINTKRRIRENLHPLLDAGGNLVTRDEEKAEVLNAFFTSVFSGKTGCSLDTQYPELVEGDGEQDVALTIHEELVGDLLRHLDVHKSMGPDGIHPRVLRELAEELAKPLSIIYQQSWLSGEVPADWRLANVTPIYKKGRRADPGNYRPVSLTSVPGKLMEQILLGVIMRHLKGKQAIRPSQHGF